MKEDFVTLKEAKGNHKKLQIPPDPKIIGKMISLVNKETFSILWKKNSQYPYYAEISVDNFIERWAIAKYNLFVLLDEQLIKEKKINISMDKAEMALKINGLNERFGDDIILNLLDIDELITNEISHARIEIISAVLFTILKETSQFYYEIVHQFSFQSEFHKHIPNDKISQLYPEYETRQMLPIDFLLNLLDTGWDNRNIPANLAQYKNCLVYMQRIINLRINKGNKMKTSKFLSNVSQNSELDIELSKIMQHKKSEGIITVSIDPVDFLMMSVNQHGWASCSRPNFGDSNSLLPYEMLCDESSVITYIHTGKDYIYDKIKYKTTNHGVAKGENGNLIFQTPFQYKSFMKRQIDYIDTRTGAIAFCRGYCSFSVSLQTEFRCFVSDIISSKKQISGWKTIDFTGKNDENTVSYESINIKKAATMGYYDPVQYFMYPDDVEFKNASMDVGYNIFI